MNFSLEQLLAFVTVYEQGAFSKAAVKLDKHRTTIGQVINNLEDQLAVILFERVGRSVEPTEEGELLYHYAKQALEQAKTFDKVALSLSFGELESINLAYCSFIPHQVLGAIRTRLKQEFPNMRVNCFIRTKSQIKTGIQDGSIHFGIVNVHDSKGLNSIDFTFLDYMSFAPFVSKNSHIATLPKSKVLKELQASKQFVLSSLIEDDMGEKVIFCSDHEVIDQLALMMKFVQLDLGWSFLPRMMVNSDYVSTHLTELKVEQMQQAIKIPLALWSPHSKQVAKIKKPLIEVINEFIVEAKTSN
ncbi:LysR family transcriptional regulator [Shewanella gaetbuli]|uniref:LysR family transcriptional regulator n=1 Tax=Shewanella gaetbuli TaxID=220752 RepID=A0A9X1ZI94_9GAMM|nr:LysR family transcriptional regulator [Shewanella gaetbuli]MCL1142829.1 LysR family transcriptional regulator [Shewanella gaetbuli]